MANPMLFSRITTQGRKQKINEILRLPDFTAVWRSVLVGDIVRLILFSALFQYLVEVNGKGNFIEFCWRVCTPLTERNS